ncbi:MAG: Dam family site-specific DNA-(adenine-N6)-methyltransferase [Dehalococcoidia bacterium]|nr:MAG: Dam family site-specific DNA-(adenine-N6)-methyltransferase [Armatimonadota bacterium]MCL4230377.1 Dam family site-specific DNA-(adenine-N6)-methyltransferase [Dehalococcoidia bacterium]
MQALAPAQEKPFVNGRVAEPFVKWVGGKRSLIPEILPRMPKRIGTYHEPFVGGGALFFAIADQIDRAVLTDNNFELVLTYSVVKRNPRELIAELERHAAQHQRRGEDHYYAVRAGTPSEPIDIAARFIYLNKTCYNGLYRVNQAGRFNVPMGKQASSGIVAEANIMACHRALRKATIRVGDFGAIRPEQGDLVYFDPPYHPTSDVSFTKYTKENFTEHDHVRLRDFATELGKRGVNVMLSNSNTKLIRGLYGSKAFHRSVVMSPRLVNCKPTRRGAVEELLIRNYMS